MATNNNNGKVSAEALQAAIAGLERFATVAGGRANLSNAINRTAFATRFPGVKLADALVAGAAAGSFVLSGADMQTVVTNDRATKIKADIKAKSDKRNAEAKATRIELRARLQAARFGAETK